MVQSIAFYIGSLTIVLLYFGGIEFWTRWRNLNQQFNQLRKESVARDKAASRLKKTCDQRQFEAEWYRAIAQNTTTVTGFLDILKRWSSSPNSFHGWVIMNEEQWEGTNREHFPQRALQRYRLQADGKTIAKSRNASDFHGLPDELEKLTFFAVNGGESNTGVLIVSQIPTCFQLGEDTERLANLIKAAKFRTPHTPERLVTVEDEVENQIAKEMLEIRSLLDEEFQSPADLTQGFLQKLVTLSGYTFASLFLITPKNSGKLSHFASGGTLTSEAVYKQWCRGERVIIDSYAGQLKEMLFLNPETLLTFDRQIPFHSAVLIPVRADADTAGALILTSVDAKLPGNDDAQLMRWSSEFLMKTLNREISRINTIDQARRDSLTNLANRRTFDTEFASAVERTECGREICSLVMLDIDHFKSINDTYGHPVGDQVIREIAATLQKLSQNLRVTDHVLPARYGGEEFAMLLPKVDLLGALRIAEELRARIEQLQIASGGEIIRVTASLGVACSDRHGKNCEELLHYADEALYEAKKTGRNRVCSTRLNVLQGPRGV